MVHCNWNKFNEPENLGETAVSAVSHLVTTLLIAGRGSICANIIKGMGTLKSVCSSWFGLISRDEYEHNHLRLWISSGNAWHLAF